MNKLIVASAACAAVVSMSLDVCAAGLWWENPAIRAAVKTCAAIEEDNQQPAPHFMNVSGSGTYLALDNSCQTWDYSHPVQLFRVSDLVALSGTVEASEVALVSGGAKDIFAGTVQDKTATGPGGWKGAAVCDGVILVGTGRSSAQHFAAFSTAATGSWTENSTAFAVTAGDFGFDGSDFNAAGTALYSNNGATQGQLVRWNFADLLAEGAALTVDATYVTSAKRIRSVNVYTIGGADLLYYGEGSYVAGTNPAKVWVWDVTSGTENELFDCSDVFAESDHDIMNVKVSGAGTDDACLYVTTGAGELFVYRLAADGKSVLSTTPAKVFSKDQVRALCKRKAISNLRAFEVSADGKYAFFTQATNTDEPQALLTVVGYDSRLNSIPLPKAGLVAHLDASDTATMTLDADGRVTAWRSKTGDVAFQMKDGQNPTNLPYYQPSILVPATAQVPGVVFGLEAGYAYVDGAADKTHNVRTYLAGSQELATKEVIMVMVRLQSAALWGYDILGQQMLATEGVYFRTGVANRHVKAAGNNWSSGVLYGNYFTQPDGLAWLDGTLVYDYHADPKPAAYREYSSYTGFVFDEKKLAVLDLVASDESLVGVPSFGGGEDQFASCMVLCEALVYDRQLTDAERQGVYAALGAKWQTKTPCRRWTGNGATTDWRDCGNWDGLTVPASSETVAIEDATVTAAEPVTVDGRVALSGSTLTVPSFLGGGTISDLSASSTLVIDADETAKLEPSVGGAVTVRKCGAGDVLVSGDQSYTGATVLEAGRFAAVSNLACEAMAGLTLHLDASREDTITYDADGNVAEWRSITDPAFAYRDASVALPGETRIARYPAWRTLDDGKPAVVLGWTPDNVNTGSCMQATKDLTFQTLFFVTRQPAAYGMGAIFGVINDTSGRICRSTNSGNCWQLKSGWISGQEYKTEDNKELSYSNEKTPHVLVVRNGSAATLSKTTRGVAWAFKSPTEVNAMMYVNDCAFVHEVLVFNRSLSDDEVRRVQASLMAKWGIAPKAPCALGNTLSPNTEYLVKGAATLDFGGMLQPFGKMTLDAGEGSPYPILTLVGIPGALDLTGTVLKLAAEKPIARGQKILLSPDATVAGPFASIEGLDASAQLKYRANDIRYSCGGAMLLMR